MPKSNPLPKNYRKQVSYWVCCDCRNCREETGLSFMSLDWSYKTEGEAIQALERYSMDHSSCFVARETLETIEAQQVSKPQRPQRKRRAA